MEKAFADGTGQVERDFGGLKTVLDVQSWPMIEDGDTASWLVEIFADGPRSEEEVATRLESSGAEGSDEVVLEATPFTRVRRDVGYHLSPALSHLQPRPEDARPEAKGDIAAAARNHETRRVQ